MPARAFEESHCGTSNGAVYLHLKLNCISNTSPNQCGACFPDDIVAKIQRGERRALPQHLRQPPSPCSPYAITIKIQPGEQQALPQHPCQPPCPFIP